MKKAFTLTRRRAFTLIELLIVIGIMAVIAAGVVALIDPVQKTRQALDSNSQNAIGQLATALQSYAAQSTTGTYPTAAVGLTALVTSGEIKSIPAFPQGVASWNYQVNAGLTDVAIFAVMQAAKNGAATNSVWCWRSAWGNARLAANAAACVP